MPSIQLQIRKTNKDFTDKAERTIVHDGKEYFEQRIWFKKIETMDKNNDLFVECSDLPEEVKKQINQPEKEY